MDTNKMREQFEEWAVSARAHGELFDLSHGNHGAYKSPITHWLYCSWVASYQASRETLVVDLPPHEEHRCDTSWEEARQDAYNRALDESRSAIEAQGLKVAP